MTEPTVILTFPEKNCKKVTVKDVPCISIDTELTAEELIEMLMRYYTKRTDLAIAMKKEENKA